MKKKLIVSLLLTSMVVTMAAGCGKQKEASVGEQNANGTEGTSGENSDDAIANLIAATDGTVELTLWCSETTAYQTVMKEIVEDFKATYPEVEFDITIGAESEANCKDDVLADVETAADVFVLQMISFMIL